MATTTPRTIPGSSVSALGTILEMRRKGFLEYVQEQWETHGDIFQISVGGTTMVFMMHPDHVHYVTIGNRKNYDKLKSYDAVRKYALGNGVLTSRGDLWRRQRKLMAPFYTPRGVQVYADIFLKDAQKLVERWDKLAQQNAQVDIFEEMTLVTARIILKAMFSMETDESITRMKNAVETMIAYSSSSVSLSRMLPRWFPTKMNRDYQRSRTMVFSYINGVIEQRRALAEDEYPDDLLSRLMLARDEETGQAMSAELLRDESITTFFAGHETTARTMTFLWYALAENPEVAQKLQAELDSVVGDRLPTLDDLHNLPYSLQVIKETLRLYPAAPLYARDAVEDDTYDGYRIPAESRVMLSPYFTHRHPDFWEDPQRFDPERWTPEREAERHPQAYHPFASGQRICLGNNFSLLETHILVAVLAARFYPKLQPGFHPEWKMRGVLSTANGMPMTITAR